MKKLFVAIPCYTGEIGILTMHSLLFALEELKADGWEIKPEWIHSRISDADIGHARNVFLGYFLDSPCTDLLFLDCDISWGRGALKQLLSHGEDFVAGAYRQKREDKDSYPVLWPEKKNMITDGKSQKPLVEVDGVGFGFCKLSRDGVQRLYDNTQRKFNDLHLEVSCPWVFEFAWDGDQRKSEDYTFCKRWQEAGMKCWLDPSLNIDHQGRKLFNGDILTHMRDETLLHQMAEVESLQSDAA